MLKMPSGARETPVNSRYCSKPVESLILDPGCEDPLQPRLHSPQVYRFTAVDGDQAGLRSLRLSNVCDRDRVNIGARRILEFGKMYRQLASVQYRLGRRVRTAF